MNGLSEIHEYSTAEFLARNDEFRQSTLAPYLEQARLAIVGTGSDLDEETIRRIKLHRLLLENEEEQFLVSRPDLRSEFANADAHQLAMVTSPYNLDYFMEHGIDYEFDAEKRDHAQSIVELSNSTATQALMREKILSLSGFDGVSTNFIFHDVLDHAWLFNFMRDHKLDQRYADFVDATGNPFKGHLMSRESELLSGIGFTSRRFLADENYYGSLAMNSESLIQLIRSEDLDKDPRVEEVIDFILEDEATSAWIGFVIKATVSNLILQRERWGGVKELTRLENGSYAPTGNTVSLTDSRYLSLIIDTVRLLAANKRLYMSQEVTLNTTVESILQRFLDTGEASGSIAVIQSANPNDRSSLESFGLSTNHFPNNKNTSINIIQ